MLSLQILFVLTIAFACWCAYKMYSDEQHVVAGLAGFIWGMMVVPLVAVIDTLIWQGLVYLFTT